MVDIIVVGMFIGKEALAAVGGTTGTLIDLQVGLLVGLSSGASVVTAQFYGGKNMEKLHKSVHTAMAMGILGGLIMTAIGIIFAPPLMRAIQTPPEVLPLAVTYIRIFFSGMAASFVYNVGAGILRAVGDTKRPLYFLLITCVTNLLLDLLFVVVFHMGIAGVAAATVISQFLSAALVVVTLAKSNDSIKLSLREIRIDWQILLYIIKIGVPAGLQSMMFSISNIFIKSFVNSFGTNTMAAWTAYNKVDSLNCAINNAFAATITTFSGQNFGAGKFDRLRRLVSVSMIICLTYSFGMGALMWGTGQYMVRLFTSDPQVIAISTDLIKTIMPFYFTYAAVEVFSSTIRGTGQTTVPMILTLLGICGFRLFWLYSIAPHLQSFTQAITCYPITWALTSVLMTIYYFRKRWFQRALAARQKQLEPVEEIS